MYIDIYTEHIHFSSKGKASIHSANAPLTTGLDLSDVVAGEPASPAVVCALPPAPFLHSSDMDDISFRKGKLIFICLLEVKLCSYYQLIVAIIGHVLKKGEEKKNLMKYSLSHYGIIIYFTIINVI